MLARWNSVTDTVLPSYDIRYCVANDADVVTPVAVTMVLALIALTVAPLMCTSTLSVAPPNTVVVRRGDTPMRTR